MGGFYFFTLLSINAHLRGLGRSANISIYVSKLV